VPRRWRSRAGASVVVADLAEEANQETASLIEQSGGRPSLEGLLIVVA
jgi:hypothetical protein